MKKQDRNAAQGILELENDAEQKGLNRKEGRKAFYRYASHSSRSGTHLMSVGDRFRVFYMACAELFGLNKGEE